MARTTLIFTSLAVLALVGATYLIGVQQHIGLLLESQAEVNQREGKVSELLGDLNTRFESLFVRMAAREQTSTVTRGELQTMEESLVGLAKELAAVSSQISAQGATLASTRQELASGELHFRFESLQQDLESRLSAATDSLRTTARLARSADQAVRELGLARLATSEEQRWSRLVAPSVQLAGNATVGSGVLLEACFLEDEQRWQTLLLTAWHVVRDILEYSTEGDEIPVTVYLKDGTKLEETAHILAQDVGLDTALLELDCTTRIAPGAALPSVESLSRIRVFRPIYAVGCPLGNDPIPTRGELADLNHELGESLYWMISAPTYIGNSGGGVFDGETLELVGIFTKIYTHGGSLRQTVVPHMGLVTPLTQIYDWLVGCGYTQIGPEGSGRALLAGTSVGER